ncbi:MULTISPECIES: hypothetical protein [Actinomadura]|uniref:Uncharacterized protein n=1 Tax=Actinomadura yumaensis TaxID=111807 RepID=A0ABW2CK23_9ACTN|nr:hypothetical protein [Actinomadura sp. J1-007]MWK38705.1 hypothetical protein [Actinomadura sp. J1-007]
MREEREQIGPHEEVPARFRGARLYGDDEDGTAYLAERAGVPYLIVRAASREQPAVTVIAFTDERERAAHLAERARRRSGGAPVPPFAPALERA